LDQIGCWPGCQHGPAVTVALARRETRMEIMIGLYELTVLVRAGSCSCRLSELLFLRNSHIGFVVLGKKRKPRAVLEEKILPNVVLVAYLPAVHECLGCWSCERSIEKAIGVPSDFGAVVFSNVQENYLASVGQLSTNLHSAQSTHREGNHNPKIMTSENIYFATQEQEFRETILGDNHQRHYYCELSVKKLCRYKNKVYT
jgi:hypothetical protein